MDNAQIRWRIQNKKPLVIVRRVGGSIGPFPANLMEPIEPDDILYFKRETYKACIRYVHEEEARIQRGDPTPMDPFKPKERGRAPTGGFAKAIDHPDRRSRPAPESPVLPPIQGTASQQTKRDVFIATSGK